MTSPSVSAVVLAAGKGTRLKATSKNKVVYQLANKPIISYTIDNLRRSGITKIVVVVGFAGQSVKQALGDSVDYALQSKRLGTANAVKMAFPKLDPATDLVITLYGDDSAFYPPSLFQSLITSHQNSNAVVSLVTVNRPDPTGLGRILRNSHGVIQAIVEEKNATSAQKRITEINTGLYCFNYQFLISYLPKITKNPLSGEYYLTDIVSLAVKHGLGVNAVTWPDTSVWQGVNTPAELEAADMRMKRESNSS